MMESNLNIPDVDLSFVRKYSLADIDEIDFSSSDDFAIVVENLKNVITLMKNIEEFWTEDHEQILWQFVIDPDSCVFTSYFFQDTLVVECNVPKVPIEELFYFIKVFPEELVSDDYNHKLLYGTAKAPYFESLYQTLCTVFSPMFSKSTDWSKCIKLDYVNHISKFISELFDMRNKLQQELIFYVPKDIANNSVSTIIEMKDTLNQLEETVMKWLWLLKSVMMKKDSDVKGNFGPLDEIKLWELKSADLEKVLHQLKREDVKKCIEVLKTAKLVSFSKFSEVNDQLQNEYDIALNNVKFLHILMEPCKNVETASLSDIPKHLTELLDLVRIIWNNSPYFGNPNEISNLLSKVNNFVISNVSKFIPLEDIFSNRNSDQKELLLDVIFCCNKWLEIFDFSEKVHQTFAASVWSVKSMSSIVNLFIHRCEELIQVCEFKDEFQCDEDIEKYVSGHRCYDVAKEFKAIEVHFWKLLQELGKNKHIALQIMKPAWNEYYKKFKEAIFEIEVTVSKLMLHGFENLSTIEEGIQILKMFQKHFNKQVIQRDLKRCIKYLYEIFFNEANFVKMRLINLKASEDAAFPMYGGTAFSALILPQRMEQLKKTLQEASNMWPKEYNTNIDQYYQQVLDSKNEFIHTLFLQWIKTIPKDPFTWLKEPIIKKKEDTPLFELNISSNTLNLIQELYYWDKTGVEIPQHVVHLHEKSDVFLKRIMKMLESVNNYNRAVENLLSGGDEIFSDLLTTMEDTIKPALVDFNWSVPPTDMKSTLKTFTDQTKTGKEVFSQYEINKMKIKEQCDAIGEKSLFLSRIKSPQECSDFIQIQVGYREDVLQEIAILLKAQINEVNQVYNIFKLKKLEVTANISSALTKEFTESVCSALIECYITSLKDVALLFGAHRKNNIQMILKVCLTLKNHQLYYIPNFKELCCGIEQLLDDIETALSQFMIIDGLTSGIVDEQNYFMDRVKETESIQVLKKEIDLGLYRLYEAEKNYKAEWDPFACLWETKKDDLLKEYEKSGWNSADFERDINHFLEVGQKLLSNSRYKALEFCLVDCQQLKDAGAECSEVWKSELGLILRKIACSNLQTAYDLFEITASKFKEEPCNLQELTRCIHFLINVKKCAAEVENTFVSIEQNFDALVRLDVPVDKKVIDYQRDLPKRWEELQNDFEKYYVKLQKVQAIFQRNFLEYHDELENHATNLARELIESGPFQLTYSYPDALDLISYYHAVFLHLKRREALMKKDAVFFHITLKPLEKLKSIEEELNDLQLSWTYVKQYNGYIFSWKSLPVMNFTVDKKKEMSDDLQNNVGVLKKRVKGTHWILLEELLFKLSDLNDYYAVIVNFQDTTLQKRHWDDLHKILGITCEDSESYFKSNELTFDVLLSVRMDNIFKNVSTVVICAREEFKILQSLKEIEEVWKTILFKMHGYENLLKIDDTEHIVSVIEQHQATLRAMKASKYVSYFSESVHSMGNSLLLILDVVKQTELFQSKFFLLDKIFSEQAVQVQLPKEASEVQDLRLMWKNITDLISNELVWKIGHRQGFLNSLIEMNKGIEDVHRSLELYLDSKRRAFPRFYFVSNDDLISIIGQKHPQGIQPYFIKCFDSINKLKIVEKVEETLREKIVTIFATGMYSEFEEFVEFTSPVVWDGPVESWLLDIEEMMKTTLCVALPKCTHMLNNIISKDEFNFSQNKWLNNWSGQICLLSMLITWTADVTNSIKIVQDTAATVALKNLKKKWRDILNQFVQKLKGESLILMQRKAMMIIIMLSHSCDVIESLVKFVCNNVDAFEWLVHLRYYIVEKNACSIRQSMADFKYDFEYLGKHERLVITPLTDRCFLSLTTALYLNQGAILKGHRNSGKTETIKALGVTLGKYVLTINCSENLDHQSVVRMLSGIAQIGAWGLFEDFNLVKVEIMSVLSQQIQHIFKSLAEKKPYFSFLGNDISLQEGCAIFVSTNPDYPSADYKYPTLFRPVTFISPDVITIIQVNLCAYDFRNSKSADYPSADYKYPTLFRPVTFISPDVITIIQVNLCAYDFRNSKSLASDIQLVFTMAEDQLHKQNYITFGLNTVIKFLKYMGNQKRMYPKLSDLEIVSSSFKDVIMPKLDLFDVSIFEGILESVLGSIKRLDISDSKFSEKIEEILLKNFLQPVPYMISKVNQFHEMKMLYHAIILLGESGSGKTVSWQTLKGTYSNLHHTGQLEFPSVNTYILNSQAYSLDELYGYFTETRSWKDGLFPSVLREACCNTKCKERWIVFNGPIDTDWLGSINSLLDSSKTLTLINGERIMLPPEVSLVFESSSLTHCSPSIASKCGIVFYESTAVHWKLHLRSWIQTFEADVCNYLEKFAEKHLESVLIYCQRSLKSFTSESASLLNGVTSFTKIMNAMIKKTTNETIALLRIFWMSVTWSIGAVLDEKDRILFDQHVKEIDSSLNLPSSIYDYGLDKNFEWTAWNEFILEKWKPQPNVEFENLLIPTKTTVSYQNIIETLLEDSNPVLLIGQRGSGKSIIVENLLHKISHNQNRYTYITVNISPQTTSSRLQQLLETQLEEKAGGLLLPLSGKRLIAFLDDLKIATYDESQSHIELLHMTIDNQFWYNRKEWKVNYVQDVCFLAAGQPPVSYNKATHPLLNRFNILKVVPLKEPEMKHIFVNLLKEKLLDLTIEMQRILYSISLGSIIVYRAVQEAFLPIPTKIHYLFGIRDIKRVLHRILDMNCKHFSDRLMITKFWFHEFSREFSDRFCSQEDRNSFTNMLHGVTEKEFLIDHEQIYRMQKSPRFVKFLHSDGSYDEVVDYEALKIHFETSIAEFKKLHEDWDFQIVLFDQNLEHLCNIIQSIENPHGSILLLGAAGTGKKSLCRIAAFIIKYEIFQLNLETNYGMTEFKQDMQKLLYDVGIKKKQVLFVLSGNQVFNDIIFHYLSEILTIGLPYDIFKHDELNILYLEVSSNFQMPMEQRECHNLLARNIKEHLHLAICFSYDFLLYKTIFLKYPALQKSCTIDWFDEWPDDALESVATKCLKDIDLSPRDSQRFEVCCHFLSMIHTSALKYSKSKYGSDCQAFEVSCTFIKLVNSFKIALAKKQQRVEHSLHRLVSGLQKINETQEKVNEIAKETKEAREKLIIAERECEEALRIIQEKKTMMALKKEIIQEKKVEIEKKERVCRKIAIAAEEDLNAALPALEEARKALDALNKKDISEIKSYAKPPVLIEIVLESVMILRESEPTWAEAKRQLGSPTFLKELYEYDRDNISDSALAKVGKYVKKPEFQPNLVGKVSVAAKSLCIWVKAMHLYGNIYKKVKPKKEKLRVAKEELDKLQRTLASLLQELKELEESILQLEREHKILIEKKEEYARREKELALKLQRAENIIEGLSSEKEKWQLKIDTLSRKKAFIVGDSLIASGYLIYLGPHDQTHRTYMGNQWKKKISETVFSCSSDFDLADFFVDEDVMSEWKMHGLPSDQYSYEGASIVRETIYWPFLIDPEEQAVTWIKNLSAKQEIKCTDFGGLKWMSVIESAITKGFPVLLQNVNHQRDSSLISLLKKPQNSYFLYFNDKKLKMNSNFRLYFSTKLLKPQVSSAVVYQTSIVSFTIKEKGLEDQLLPLIVQNERSDLEMKKDTLVNNIQDCKNKLSEIEDTILKLLSTSQGSLLEDETLVQALARSKSDSIEMEDKLTSSKKTEAIIDSARDKYRPCAKMASILYFVLTDMTFVDPLYVFTLDSYINMFLNSIHRSPKDPEPSRRTLKLNAYHKKAVYKYACRSVLENHSLLLAFHMSTRILLEEGKLDKAEYQFFIKGRGEISDHSNELLNPCSQWLSQECWGNIIQIERLPKFLSITVSFDENSRLWQDWYLTAEPEKKPLPGIWRNVCSGFQMLLIIRCLRLDRITSCVRSLISSTLGKSFLQYPDTDLREIYKESVPNKPFVMFSLSSEIDLEKIIGDFANTFQIKYRTVSLGEGQENAASQLIIDSAKMGFWAYISNCHHLLSWLPALEKFVNRLQTIKVHENFRLWLGLSPTNLFPTSILQNSIILSYDSPKGIQSNMLKLYDDLITDSDIESSACQSKYRNLLFSLSFFHSILVGRKKFQNLGWNCDYNFSKEDFKISALFLKLFLNEYKDTPWDALKKVIAETIYGGHLTDEQDEQLLMTYFDQYFCDEACANIKYRLAPVAAFYIPEERPVEGYIQFIQELPPSETPDVYGQHCNAEIPYQIQDAISMLEDMAQISTEGLSQKNEDNLVSGVISDIKLKIPNLIDEDTAINILHEKNEPYNKVLLQETKQYNNLLKLVSYSLNQLEKGISGKEMMTEEMDELLGNIQKMEVPKQWLKAYPSMKSLGSWIQDLKLRVEQINKWVTSGIMPVKLWLPGFTNPKSILNATLQTTAKDSDVILKELVWEHHVSSLDEIHITEAPPEGVYISGLLLEGAGWDKTNSILIEPESLHLTIAMPVILFKPVIESSVRGVYHCPCYYTPKRTDEKENSSLIFSVDLKTKKGREHWIKRGTSLLLSSK